MRPICEAYPSLDVRCLHRAGQLDAGQSYSVGGIHVRTEQDAVLLGITSGIDGSTVEQWVPITWTRCHLGGQRPWFICCAFLSGQCCKRRVAALYLAGRVFACRHCYGLAYASQQENPRDRLKSRANANFVGEYRS